MGLWNRLVAAFKEPPPAPVPVPTERELKKAGAEPWADLQFLNGKLVVVDYNDPFVKNLRATLGDLVDDETSDDVVVQLYVDRENLEREEPRLEILHMGIEEDGQLKIKLDWNKAFIDHLRKNGIVGETEDDAIKAYLSRLTTETADIEGELGDVLTRDQINEAFRDIDNVAQRELDDAAASVKNAKKPRRRRKSIEQ